MTQDVWVCSDCGKTQECDFEDIYLKALIKEADLTISNIWCTLCGLKRESPLFTTEEGYKLLEVAARRRVER